jgi:hypothetical protein
MKVLLTPKVWNISIGGRVLTEERRQAKERVGAQT